ncbi:hypothetical protein L0Y69_03000, partial [bacterium]|nr:hypothetical protein [bacterium]
MDQRASLEPEEGVKFRTPEEEIGFLREEIRRKEETLERFRRHTGELLPDTNERERVISEKIKEYGGRSPEEVLAPEYAMQEEEVGEIVLHLSPETHDRKMEELLGILEERGIMNALSVAGEMDNPHIDDDFHRVLVQYVKTVEKEEEKSHP